MAKRAGRPQNFIPDDQFKAARLWLRAQIQICLVPFGGDGIEGGQLAILFGHRAGAPEGWHNLSSDQQRRQFWQTVRRLEKERRIETYHSAQPGHNKSRTRLRLSNVLDRMSYALETGDTSSL